jgi:hypothetical protein
MMPDSFHRNGYWTGMRRPVLEPADRTLAVAVKNSGVFVLTHWHPADNLVPLHPSQTFTKAQHNLRVHDACALYTLFHEL